MYLKNSNLAGTAHSGLMKVTFQMCNTSLMYAARGNHPHTCQELLSHGADYSLSNLNDDSAHQLAIENNSTLAQAVIENFICSKLEESSSDLITSKLNSPKMDDDYA
ncbi:unnamed protein product [Phaedon cochleariae]|uniref:Uncharacterized protein n=1 Tax=Phaedon cochleariae TaxID=80249 RepID=A0A9N9SL81_PHACE|nr:unnamed protein product [Phaedon cochleariae]